MMNYCYYYTIAVIIIINNNNKLILHICYSFFDLQLY